MTALRNQIGLLLKKLRKALAGNSKAKDESHETTLICSICVEDTHVDQMFVIQSCKHTYCFSCMSKHVHYKLREGILPECPDGMCKSSLKLKSYEKFLSPELLEITSLRVKEAYTPAAQRVYCPYPKCSALWSKTELRKSVSNSTKAKGCRKCLKCNELFCINCKAPWHRNMSCDDFSSSNEDHKLKTLAILHKWRQCPNCNTMVSLEGGCYHIFCRCGHDFCYSCGKLWNTCACSTISIPDEEERNLDSSFEWEF